MSFMEFENLLKCPICFDFFNICMATSCSHNYCSLCIRKYLTYKTQCPLCFEETSEPELRTNRLVDNIVRTYVRNRSQFSRCLVPDNIDSEGQLNATSNQSTATEDLLQIQMEGSLNEPTEKAPCPVCEILVKVTSINAHLDMCLNRDERKESRRRGNSKNQRKKLSKVVYHFLAEKELKKIVSESGLNSDGDRQTLIKRHKSYLTLYNSECDSLNPRPVSEIIKQVNDEEKLEERLAKVKQTGLDLDKKMNTEIIECKQQAYMKEHQSQFAQLVENIQQRQRKRSKLLENTAVKKKSFSIDDPSTSTTSKSEGNHIDETVSNNQEIQEDSNDKDPDTLVIDNASEVGFSGNEKNVMNKLSISRGSFQQPSSESEGDSRTSTPEPLIRPTRNTRLRKASLDSEPKDECAPLKRTRHPSDEF